MGAAPVIKCPALWLADEPWPVFWLVDPDTIQDTISFFVHTSGVAGNHWVDVANDVIVVVDQGSSHFVNLIVFHPLW